MLPSDGGVYVQDCQRISRNDILLWGSLSEMFITRVTCYVTWRRWSSLPSVSSVKHGRQPPVWALTSVQKCIRFYTKSGNACCHSVQNRLSSILLPKVLKIIIYRNIILPADCMGVNLVAHVEVRKVGWGCLRIGCREEYLCLSGESKKGELRKLHNEELDDPYNPTNIFREIKSRRMSWAGRVAHRGERRGVGRVLVGKPEGKISFGRPRNR